MIYLCHQMVIYLCQLGDLPVSTGDLPVSSNGDLPVSTGDLPVYCGI